MLLQNIVQQLLTKIVKNSWYYDGVREGIDARSKMDIIYADGIC